MQHAPLLGSGVHALVSLVWLSRGLACLSLQDVSDPAVMVAFPLVEDPDSAALVAWTTTPWTLPSNLALCVNANFTYVKVSRRLLTSPGLLIKQKGVLIAGSRYTKTAHLIGGYYRRPVASIIYSQPCL